MFRVAVGLMKDTPFWGELRAYVQPMGYRLLGHMIFVGFNEIHMQYFGRAIETQVTKMFSGS